MYTIWRQNDEHRFDPAKIAMRLHKFAAHVSTGDSFL